VDAVFSISGDSRGSDNIQLSGDYTFCKYPLIWGWASWRRVWQNYDVEILDWPNRKRFLQKKISDSTNTTRFWISIFDNLHKNRIDTWDYQFSYLHFVYNASCIVPKVNLVSNIGFGRDATHTVSIDANANRPLYDVLVPLNHDTSGNSKELVDQYFDTYVFYRKSIIHRIQNKLSKIIKNS
jgi:hypothetical protein